jgi:EmrB/QacA subfamily drug resistance transporter
VLEPGRAPGRPRLKPGAVAPDAAAFRLGNTRAMKPITSKAAQRWTLVAAILGSSMAFVDGTVVNVALPAIQRTLDASAAEMQWVVEAYALFLASLLLVGGALGDRLGRRRIFMIGASIFVAASIACALSPGIVALIVARAVQGVGAALLVPGSLALLSATFPEAQRGAAIGTWSAFSGITAAIGPVIGGFLVDHYSWTWAFLINIPVGAVLLFLCATRVPESVGGHGDQATVHAPIDIAGAVLATVGLAGIVFALIEAPMRGWSNAAVIASAAIGVAALALFVRVERRTREPMLPLGLFGESNFAGANLLTLLLYAALGGALYFLPLNLVQVQGFGATAAGAAFLPFIAIMFALSRWAGKLVDRFGAKRPLVIGPAIAALGFAWFAVPGVGANFWTTFLPAICVLGLGMSITVAPLTTTVMNAVDRDLSGTASGINNAVSRTAGLLAIALFGIVVAWAFGAALDVSLGGLHLAPDVRAQIDAQRFKLAGIVVPEGLSAPDPSALKHAVGAAFVSGFRWVMLISAGLALLSAVAAWRMIDAGGDGHRPPR